MKLSPILFFLLIFQIAFGQFQDKVDFTSCAVEVYVQASEKKVSGKYQIEFKVLKDVDSIFLDAHNMKYDKISMTKYGLHRTERMPIKPISQKDKLILKGNFEKGESYTLKFEYDAQPKQTVYFLGWDDTDSTNNQIWTQGQGKYTSHWLPSLDDMNDKMEFDLSFIVDKSYTVIANGKLIARKALSESKKHLWQFDMLKPMSSYLVAFVMGNFEKKTLTSKSGIPMELYYEPKDSLKVEPTYRYTKQIFDFLEEEIGTPYPWQNYKQIPVQDFLYAGMENTGTTIFSNTFMVDSIAFVDKNYVNVNAHELAHQWFGNLVTEVSGEHHWLHEGFATYYAYLTEKEIFGENYFYWKLYETATSLSNFSEDGNGEALTNPNAGSLTFYEKGAWALVMLRERVGDIAFQKGIRAYLEKYAYQNVTISNFMDEIREASGQALLDFEKTWLQDEVFPMQLAKNYLTVKSPSLQLLFELEGEFENLQSDDVDFEKLWNATDSNLNLKKELIRKYWRILPNEILLEALDSEKLELRQAFIASTQNIKAYPIQKITSLLEDKSYLTIENALLALWATYPENRIEYLDKTEDIEGLPNKNMRILWLALALATPDYQNDNKPKYYMELSDFTSSKYHFEVRSLAFQYLENLGAFSDSALINLVNATQHHVWYFKRTSRKILQRYMKGGGNKARLTSIYSSLNKEEKEYLNTILKE